MPSFINNAPTPDAYTDASTVTFSYPRAGFSVAVFNAGIYYQLAYAGLSARELIWEALEHNLAPSFNSFNNPAHEGLPPEVMFMGIRVRSAVAGTPARVIVT